jgi:proteic killer suppression protein
MDAQHADPDLERLETDKTYSGGWGQSEVKGFRKVIGAIRAAVDERDLRNMRSLNFEKLKGDRGGQYSLRINKQWRLIVELDGEGQRKTVRVIEIVDYH